MLRVHARSAGMGDSELFTVAQQGQCFSVRAWNRMSLSSSANGAVTAKVAVQAEAELFNIDGFETVLPRRPQLSIGGLAGASLGPLGWGSTREIFEAVDVGGKTALLSLSNGKYLSQAANGSVSAAEVIGPSEIFTITSCGAGVALCGPNGSFLVPAASGIAEVKSAKPVAVALDVAKPRLEVSYVRHVCAIRVGKLAADVPIIPDVLPLAVELPKRAIPRPKLSLGGMSAPEVPPLRSIAITGCFGTALGVDGSGAVGWGAGDGKFAPVVRGDKVAFLSANGKFISVREDGTLSTSEDPASAEEFTIASAGTGCSIQASNGLFVSADKSGQAKASAEEVGDAEIFNATELPVPGTVTIKGLHGSFLGVDGDRASFGPEPHRFKVLSIGGGVALSAANGRNLSLLPDGALGTSTSIGARERLVIERVGSGCSIRGADLKFLTSTASGIAYLKALQAREPQIFDIDGIDSIMPQPTSVTIQAPGGSHLGVSGWGEGDEFEAASVGAKSTFRAVSNGKFLSLSPSGALSATADEVGPGELFDVTDSSLRGPNGKFLVGATSGPAECKSAQAQPLVVEVIRPALQISYSRYVAAVREGKVVAGKPAELPRIDGPTFALPFKPKPRLSISPSAAQEAVLRVPGAAVEKPSPVLPEEVPLPAAPIEPTVLPAPIKPVPAPPPPPAKSATSSPAGALMPATFAEPVPQSTAPMKPPAKAAVRPALSGPIKIPAPSPAAAPKITPQKSHPVVAPLPPEIDVGVFEAVAGESSEHNILAAFSHLGISASSNVTAKLDMTPPAATLVSVRPTMQHLALGIVADYRIGGEYPFKITVTCASPSSTAIVKGILKVKHAKPEPFGMSSVIGGTATADIPFKGQIWAKANWTAKLEPPMKGIFRVTATKGTMDPGARVFPFKLIFTPHDPRQVVCLLVVVINESEEFVTEITGAVGGFQGKSWGKRSHVPLTGPRGSVDIDGDEPESTE